jgi:hypothetical protein|tara:strand:+ start:35 stop:253 length:219 start_codon:yes stop_codon:yes gene_type:complete
MQNGQIHRDKPYRLGHRYNSGQLVKNVNTGEIGVVLDEDTTHKEYYSVLCDGKIISWFSYNLFLLNADISNE